MFARFVTWGATAIAVAGGALYLISGYMWLNLRIGNVAELYADGGILSTPIIWDRPPLPSGTTPIAIEGSLHASEGSAFYVYHGMQCWTFALSDRGAFLEFPIWIIAATGILVACLFGRTIKRRTASLACSHCGCCVVGVEARNCPECGTPIRQKP